MVILLAVLLLFGAKRLPSSARSLGQALRIFKAETRGLRDEEQPDARPAAAAPQQIAAPAPAPAPAEAEAQPAEAQPAEAQPAEARRTNQAG